MPRRADVLICPYHGALMQEVPDRTRQGYAPLRRCDKCTAEFRAAWAKAVACHVNGRRITNPVLLSERRS